MSNFSDLSRQFKKGTSFFKEKCLPLHLKNTFTENELDERATAEDFSVVQQEGSR